MPEVIFHIRMRFQKYFAFALGLVLLSSACTWHAESIGPVDPVGALPLGPFSTSSELLSSSELGCEEMINQYCGILYSPQNDGNLRLSGKSGALQVFQGRTKNDFEATYFFYAQAKLRNKKRLPADFFLALEQEDYFRLLQSHLVRKSRKDMALSDRISDIKDDRKLGSIWAASFSQTVIERMQKIFRNYHHLSEGSIPVELQHQEVRVRKELNAQIAVALWTKDKNWLKVKESFEQIRKYYISMLNDLELSPEIKKRWIERIKTVKLVLPGSMPEIASESDRDDCASIDTNSFYYPRLNVITVCAGDFNSEEILQTLAHELSHSIDVDTQAQIFRDETDLGKSLNKLVQQNCNHQPLSCTDWAEFKRTFPKQLKALKDFKPDLPDFLRCLKPGLAPRKLKSEIIRDAAEDQLDATLEALATNQSFVRLTKDKIPYSDGSWHKNAAFLDLCKFTAWDQTSSPFDAESAVLLFYVNEYQCLEGDSSSKMRSAIRVARDLTVQLEAELLSSEGEFSNSDVLVRRGYSSSPSERFADVLGSYALADLLDDIPDIEHRRKQYFASSAWQCTRPSLSTAFPDEAGVQRELVHPTYSSPIERRRESLSEPVRQVLGCKKDFEFDECEM